MRDFHKMKLYCLIQILKDYTDEMHGISMQEIIEQLALYGIQAERKSVYRDIECINNFGEFQISCEKAAGGKSYYYLKGKRFTLSELKFLTDAVQASRSLTVKASERLIKKLLTLGSKHESRLLRRQVRLSERAKTQNEEVLASTGIIAQAIQAHTLISFAYLNWTKERKLELRHEGRRYLAQPLAFIWKDSYYYLVAKDERQQLIRHYRVDKMQEVRMEELPQAEKLKDRQWEFNAAAYAEKSFGMFHGEETDVRLRLDEAAIPAMLDRFGSQIPLIPSGDGRFDTRVKAVVSEQFLCWILSLRTVELLGPEPVMEQMRLIGRRIVELYGA